MSSLPSDSTAPASESDIAALAQAMHDLELGYIIIQDASKLFTYALHFIEYYASLVHPASPLSDSERGGLTAAARALLRRWQGEPVASLVDEDHQSPSNREFLERVTLGFGSFGFPGTKAALTLVQGDLLEHLRVIAGLAWPQVPPVAIAQKRLRGAGDHLAEVAEWLAAEEQLVEAVLEVMKKDYWLVCNPAEADVENIRTLKGQWLGEVEARSNVARGYAQAAQAQSVRGNIQAQWLMQAVLSYTSPDAFKAFLTHFQALQELPEHGAASRGGHSL